MEITVDDMRRENWREVRAIYAEGLASGLAAFMLAPPVWKIWDEGHLNLGRTVARFNTADNDGAIVGWSALAPAPDN